MSPSPISLPLFGNPPVVETLLGVFFQPVELFTIVRRTQFWEKYLEKDFPSIEERQPLDEFREEFGDFMPPTGRVVRWQVSPFPSSRFWATSIDRKRTVQIQNGALLANWERTPGESNDYVHYEDRRNAFEKNLRTLDQFLRHNHFGDLIPTSCFITYINHIEFGDVSQFGSVLQDSLAVWKNETNEEWLPNVESATGSLSFAMADKTGRLHVNYAPGRRNADNKHFLNLELVARGAPRDNSIDAAIEWLDKGHEWIVRGFSALTRAEKHKSWGRVQ